MPLNDLFDAFEHLKAAINEQGDYLRQFETRTRQVLIDPLLRALGWDVTDPRRVELECRIPKQYSGPAGKADYALRCGTKTVALIEAKALGKDLVDGATIQVLNYANATGIPYMVVSDGNVWRMFDVFKPLALERRVLMEFEIARDSGSTCALRSLTMWRPNIQLNRPPENAGQTVFGVKVEPPPPPPPGRWLGIDDSNLNPSAVNQPNSVIDHEGNVHEISNWAEALFTIASQLATTNKLTADMCPVRSRPTNKRYLVHTTPVHSDGTEFKQPECIKDIAPKLFLEMNASARDKVKFAKALLCACKKAKGDVDPSNVKFGFPNR